MPSFPSPTLQIIKCIHGKLIVRIFKAFYAILEAKESLVQMAGAIKDGCGELRCGQYFDDRGFNVVVRGDAECKM